jgi:hypothetical protein
MNAIPTTPMPGPKAEPEAALGSDSVVHARPAADHRLNLVLREKADCITLLVMNTISLKLPDRLLELLEAESRARRTTKSSLVRECLEKVLDVRASGGKATCYDLARDLAGSVKGLPRDLATNPKYLEGFGR